MELRSEMDKVTTEGWTDALKLVFDKDMPCAEEGDTENRYVAGESMFTLKNDGQYGCLTLLEESVDAQRPVFGRGASVLQKTEFEQQFEDHYGQMTLALDCQDIVATDLLVGTAGGFREKLLEELESSKGWPLEGMTSTEDLGEEEAPTLAMLLKKFEALNTSGIEEGVSNCIDILEAFLENVLEPLLPAEGVFRTSYVSTHDMVEKIAQNKDCRQHLWDETKKLSLLLKTELPSDHAEAWKACALKNEGFFKMALDILSGSKNAGERLKYHATSIVETFKIVKNETTARVIEVPEVLEKMTTLLKPELPDLMFSKLVKPSIAALIETVSRYFEKMLAPAFVDTSPIAMTATPEISTSAKLLEVTGGIKDSSCEDCKCWVAAVDEIPENWNRSLDGMPIAKLVGLLGSVLKRDSIDQEYFFPGLERGGALASSKILPALPYFSRVTVAIQVAVFLSESYARGDFLDKGPRGSVIKETIKCGVKVLKLFFDTNAETFCKGFEKDVTGGSPTLKPHSLRNLLSVMTSWLNGWQKDILEVALAKHINSVTKDLQGKTPRWEHAITSKKYNSILARRALLDTNASSIMSPLVDELHTAIAEALALKNAIGLPTPALDNEISIGGPVVEHGKRTIAHAAAVNIAEELAAEEDSGTLAKEILSEYTDIEGPLREKLSKMTK